jgi:hypothetical protein
MFGRRTFKQLKAEYGAISEAEKGAPPPTDYCCYASWLACFPLSPMLFW